jgi:hypothetical protein
MMRSSAASDACRKPAWMSSTPAAVCVDRLRHIAATSLFEICSGIRGGGEHTYTSAAIASSLMAVGPGGGATKIFWKKAARLSAASFGLRGSGPSGALRTDASAGGWPPSERCHCVQFTWPLSASTRAQKESQNFCCAARTRDR